MHKSLKWVSLIIVLVISTALVGLGFLCFSPKKESNLDFTNSFEEFSQRITQRFIGQDLSKFEDKKIPASSLLCEDNVYYIPSAEFAFYTGASVEKVDNDAHVINYQTDSLKLVKNDNAVKLNNEFLMLANQPKVIQGNLYIPLKEVAKILGYSVNEKNDNLVLSRPYQMKRLIVQSKTSLDDMGAIWKVEGYKDYHIFEYATEAQTKSAYDYYSNDVNVSCVMVDALTKVEENEEEPTKVYGLNDSYSYKTWGASVLGVQDYSTHILKGITESALPQIEVAVLDSGIDTDHPWFSGRIASGGKNFSSNPGSVIEYEDAHGHGTHVAGTICDLTLANVKIIPVKVVGDNGTGTALQTLQGIEYVINLKSTHPNLKVINMSLGCSGIGVGTQTHNVFVSLINSAYSAGIICAVAAGNSSDNIKDVAPANVEKAITVSAVGVSAATYLEQAYYSNFGSGIDYCAAGSSIVSAKLGGGTTTKSGTSMATPHIAGAIALLFSDPNKNYSLTDIEQTLQASSIDLGREGKDDIYGYGLVNLTYAYANIMTEGVLFNYDAGAYESAIQLQLAINNAQAKIYYSSTSSIDVMYPVSSIPNMGATQYTSEISLSQTQTLQARAFIVSSGEVVAVSPFYTKNYIVGEGYREGDFVIDENGEITQYTGSAVNLVIPEMIDNIQVKSIGSAVFRNNHTIKRVYLPESINNIGFATFCASTLEYIYAPGVINIGEYAFAGCTYLTTLDNSTFPKLKNIKQYAFSECISLGQVALNAVEEIYDSAFQMPSANYVGKYTSTQGAPNFTSVSMPNVISVRDNAFAGCSSLLIADMGKVQYIGEYAFQDDINLMQISMPNCLRVAPYAFANCSHLEAFDLHNAEYVGTHSFENTALSGIVNLPNVQIISSYAFANNTNLTQLYAPKVYGIYNCAFINCTNLQTIDVTGVNFIGVRAFYNCDVRKVLLYYIDKIQSEAFGKNYNVTEILFADSCSYASLDSFEDSSTCVFRGDYGKSLNFLENKSYSFINTQIYGYQAVDDLTIYRYSSTNYTNTAFKSSDTIVVEPYAFAGAQNLKVLVLDNVLRIEEGAFSNCPNLESVYIPKIKYLGKKAFYNCTNLKYIKLENDVQYIGEKAIGYIDNSGEDTVNTDFKICFGDNNVVNQYILSNGISSETYSYNHNFIFTWMMNTDSGNYDLVFCQVDLLNNRKMFEVPEFLEPNSNEVFFTMKEEAFKYAEFLEEIVLPKTITKITGSVFKNCESLRKINLDYITSITNVSDDAVFENCNSIEVLNFPNLTGTVDIDKIVHNCSSLKYLILPKVEYVENFTPGEHDTYTIVLGSEFKGYASGQQEIENCKIGIGCGRSNSKVYDFADAFGCTREESFLFYEGITSKTTGYQIYGAKFTINCSNFTSERVSVQGWWGAHDGTFEDAFRNGLVNYRWFIGSTRNKSQMQELYGYNSDELHIYQALYPDTCYVYAKTTAWDGVTCESNIVEISWEEQAEYIITASASAGGVISPSGDIVVNNGENQTFTIIPNAGYKINRLIIDDGEFVTGDLTSYTFSNVKANHIIYAEFVEYLQGNKVQVTITCTEGGSVSPKGGVYYDYYASVSVIITPDVGYKIARYTIDGTNVHEVPESYCTNSIQVSFFAVPNRTLHVEFVKLNFTIQITCTEGGTVTPSGTIEVAYGDPLTIHIVANSGYRYAKNIINGMEYVAAPNLYYDWQHVFNSITSNYTLHYVFVPDKYIIQISCTEGGSVTPNGTIEVDKGEDLPLSITIDNGYEVSRVLFDDQSVAFSYSYTIENISANHTFRVEFARVTRAAYRIYYYTEPLKGSVRDVYVNGTYYKLYATSNAIMGEVDTETNITAPTLAGFTNLDIEQQTISADGSTIVKVYYKRNLYKVSPQAGAGIGNIIVYGGGAYNADYYRYGEEIQVRAILQEGYKFDNWSSTYMSLHGNTNATIVFDMPYYDVNMQANASLLQYTINVSYSDYGTITGNTTVNYGESATFNIMPNNRCYLVSVWVDDVQVDNAETYTFSDVKSNHTIYASFKTYMYKITVQTDGNGHVLSRSNLDNVQVGSNVQFSIFPMQGYELDIIKVNGEYLQVKNDEFILQDVDGDKLIEATFKQSSKEETIPDGGKKDNKASKTSSDSDVDATAIYIASGLSALVVGTMIFYLVKAIMRISHKNKKIRKIKNKKDTNNEDDIY